MVRDAHLVNEPDPGAVICGTRRYPGQGFDEALARYSETVGSSGLADVARWWHDQLPVGNDCLEGEHIAVGHPVQRVAEVGHAGEEITVRSGDHGIATTGCRRREVVGIEDWEVGYAIRIVCAAFLIREGH